MTNQTTESIDGVHSRAGGDSLEMSSRPTDPGGLPAKSQAIVESCLRRARRWRPPPGWSSWEWWEENRAEVALIALDAARVYDAGRGVCWESYLRSRLMAGLLTRLRKEWKSARILIDPKARDFVGARTRIERDFTDDEVSVLYASIGRLSPADRQVLQALYWDGLTESGVALTLGISQQAISKRRKLIIVKLRRFLFWCS